MNDYELGDFRTEVDEHGNIKVTSYVEAVVISKEEQEQALRIFKQLQDENAKLRELVRDQESRSRMSDANTALAEVRSWLCDNLGSSDAGKVCGMLSVVSRRVNELEDENAELRKLARGLNWCTENAKVSSVECEHCPLGDTFFECGELSCEKLMRELGIPQ